MRRPHRDLGDFARRILVALLLGALAVVLWRLSDLAVLLFGAVLIAIGLRSATRWLHRLTGIGALSGLAVTVILLVGLFGAALWFFGTVAAKQMDELGKQVPEGLRMLVDWLQANPFGRYVLSRAQDARAAGATGWAASTLAGVMGSLTRGVGYAMLTFFVAIYLAAQPRRYRRLCLRLVPSNSRPVVEHLFDETAAVLERWLLGQLVVMVAVGVLSGMGLWALGIEAAFALGLVGGLLTFIPYVGAVLAAVPAALVALTQGPAYAFSVIGMYIGVHFVEGNLITPLVQAEATSLPPVLSLLSIVAFSILFGPIAVPLAEPLCLFLILVAEVLYVQQGPGEPALLAEKSQMEC